MWTLDADGRVDAAYPRRATESRALAAAAIQPTLGTTTAAGSRTCSALGLRRTIYRKWNGPRWNTRSSRLFASIWIRFQRAGGSLANYSYGHSYVNDFIEDSRCSCASVDGTTPWSIARRRRRFPVFLSIRMAKPFVSLNCPTTSGDRFRCRRNRPTQPTSRRLSRKHCKNVSTSQHGVVAVQRHAQPAGMMHDVNLASSSA